MFAQKQKLKAAPILAKAAAEGELDGKSYEEVAFLINERLECSATGRQIRTLARDAEIEWQRPSAPPLGALNTRISMLQNRVEENAGMIEELTKELAELRQRLGKLEIKSMPTPPDLRKLTGM